MVKLYSALWALLAAAALILFVTGNFTMITLVVFGFIVFGMIYMGMISVLPATVVHQHTPPEPVKVKTEKVKQTDGIFDTKQLATR